MLIHKSLFSWPQAWVFVDRDAERPGSAFPQKTPTAVHYGGRSDPIGQSFWLGRMYGNRRFVSDKVDSHYLQLQWPILFTIQLFFHGRVGRFIPVQSQVRQILAYQRKSQTCTTWSSTFSAITLVPSPVKQK